MSAGVQRVVGLVALALLGACEGVSTDGEFACQAASDCLATELCLSGQCVPMEKLSAPSLSYRPGALDCTRTEACALAAPTVTSRAPVTFSIAPALPSGLALDAKTGAISGTPTVLAPQVDHVITATNARGSGRATVQVTVNDLPPAALAYSPDTLVCTKREPCGLDAPAHAGGDVVSYSISPELPGLVLDATTGAISGTPDRVAPAADYVVTATNSGGSTATTIHVAVNDESPDALTYSPSTLVCTVREACQLAAPTHAGGAVLTWSVAPPLPEGLRLVPSTGAIAGVPTVVTEARDYLVTATNSGGPTSATVNVTVNDVPPAIDYAPAAMTCTKGVACSHPPPQSTGGAPLSFSVDVPLPDGLVLDAATGAVFGTPTVVASPLARTITATNSGGIGTARLLVTVDDVPPSALTYSPSSLECMRGSECALDPPLNDGGLVTGYTVVPPLPAGLALDPATGAISGTPTGIVAATSYTITATNSGGQTTATVEITVVDVPPSNLVYAPDTLVCARASACGLGPPTSDGGAVVSYDASPPLPDGLAVEATTGRITGVPRAITAQATYTVTATNSGGHTSTTVTVTVNDAAPSRLAYDPDALVCTKGVPCGVPAPTNAGGRVESFAIDPPLPTGLRLFADGTLGGTPLALSPRTTYTVTATNVSGRTTTSFDVTVNDVAPSALAYAPDDVVCTKGAACGLERPTNAGGVVTLYGIDPTLPAGMTFDPSTGRVDGTPLELRVKLTYTVTATNSGGSALGVFTLAVIDVPPTNLVYAPAATTCTKGATCAVGPPKSDGGRVVSYAVTPDLPAGLVWNASTGVVSGAASVLSPEATYTVVGTNTGGTTSATFALTVVDVPPSAMSYAGAPLVCTKGSACALAAPSREGGPVVSWSVDPPLPAGLSLDASGALTGAPTALAPAADYTVTATNSGGETTATFTLTVNDVAPSALVYSPSSVRCTKGVACAGPTPTHAGGAVVSWSASPGLPAGLSFDAAGAVTGSATGLSPSATYTVTATNSGGRTTSALTVVVVDVAPSALTYSPSSVTCYRNHGCSVAAPTSAGGPVTSFGISAVPPTGTSFSPSTGAVSGVASVTSGPKAYTVTATNTGGSATGGFTLVVLDDPPTDLAYSPTSLVCTTDQACSLGGPTNRGDPVTGYSISPGLPAGLVFDASTGAIGGTPTIHAATRTYTVTGTNSGGSSAEEITVTVNDPPPPVIAFGEATDTCHENVACAIAAPTNTGGPIKSCAVSPALPGGLTLNTATCAVSGTPTVTAAGATYTVTATNAGGTGTDTFDLTVTEQPPTSISYSPTSLTCTVGKACLLSAPTQAGGAPTSFNVSPTLPDGLAINTSTGAISGTATVNSPSTSYTVTGTNSGGSVTTTVTIYVRDPTPPIISYSSATYTCHQYTSCTIPAPTNTGGAIISCSVSPTLPSGLSLNTTTCAVSGTPSVMNGRTTYLVTATNADGDGQASFDLTVDAPLPPSITYSPSSYTCYQSVACAIPAPSNGGGPITSCTSSPTMPSGLTLQSNCSISGTPTGATGTTSYTVYASNAGGTGSTALTITLTVMPSGSAVFTTPGTSYWTVPAGVTSVDVVVVGGGGGGSLSGGGGGGLCYQNGISVTPGTNIAVTVGNAGAAGQPGSSSSFGGTSAGGGSSGTNTGGLGGGGSGTCFMGGNGGPGYLSIGGGGGGAAGYGSSGGAGAAGYGYACYSAGSSSSGGGGGGVVDSTTNCSSGHGGGGGGVGLNGTGSAGAAGTSYCGCYSGTAGNGGGGSGGVAGSNGSGGLYGGGGGGGSTGSPGANGAVRIIWGAGRSFPNNAN